MICFRRSDSPYRGGFFLRNLVGIVSFLLFVAQSANAQPAYRKRLNDGWEFLKTDLGGVWEAIRSAENGNPESVPTWREMTLPHCFNSSDAVDPDEPYYQGPGWYRTSIPIEAPFEGGRVLLHFEGAGQKTEVYIHTTKAGSHVGGYDEWTVDITDAVDAFKKTSSFHSRFDGKVPLVIRCDNSRDLQMIPSDLSDFNLYGGIYRYLNLVYVPAISIANVFAEPEVLQNGRASLKVRTEFYNPGKLQKASVSFRLMDPSGRVIDQYTTPYSASMTSVDWNTTVREPSLWSTTNPDLYTLEVAVESSSGTHVQREKIGIRQFDFEEHGPFLLNGKRLLLRGTHRHEDHAGVGGAMTEDMMRTEMIMMKEMGVNFIRLGHYQQSRIILDLCDSLGILVWEEIPWCRGGLGNEIYKDQARRMLTNMIRQHYNHPSVIIWGLGNENDWPGDFPEFDKEDIRRFMKELNDLSHQLDPLRKTAIRRCDFCKDITDVYSPSIWAGWYRGRYTEYKEVTEKEFRAVKHFLHVEWGGDSHAGRHTEEPEIMVENIRTGEGADERTGDASLMGGDFRASRDGDWSETYICNLIDWHLKEQETMPWLTGSAYWPFKDFSTPVRPDNPVPYVNQKGVIERDFTPKAAYYVFQSYWTDKPMVHIYGHTWPVRWGNAGELRPVKVYSNCDEAELYVNGKGFGVKKRNTQDFPAAGLRWNVPMKEGNNTLHVVAKKGKTIVEDKITQQFQSARWGQPAKMIVDRIDEENDTVTLQVRILDIANVQCLDAVNWIHFSLIGHGELIDNQGTSGGSRKIQAYNGRATIRVKTNSGKSIFCVKSPALPAVFFPLDKDSATP